VELKDINPIEATIVWKAGFRQQVIIYRYRGKRDSLIILYWTKAEDALLRKHYPVSPQDEVMSKLPGRTWNAITRRACKMGVRRITGRQPAHQRRRWTSTEDKHLTEGYKSGKSVELLAKELDRSVYSIQGKASSKKLTRLSGINWQESGISSESNNPTSFQSSLSGRG
jgi:hypothetical protein